VAKQLEVIKENIANANKEAREAGNKLSEVESQIQEIEKYKKELTKTKEELEKLQNSPSKPTGISTEMLDVYQEKVSGLNEQTKGKEREIQELKQELSKKDVELEKAGEEPSLRSVISEGEKTGEKFVRMVFERGDRIPLIGDAFAAIAGIGTGMAHIGIVGVEIVAYFAEKGMKMGGYMVEKCVVEGKDAYKITLESGTELAIQAGTGTVGIIKEGMKHDEEVKKELKEFIENMAKIGAEDLKDSRQVNAKAVEE